MVYTNNQRQLPRTGFASIEPWLWEVIQLFAAKWWVWLLQALVFNAIQIFFSLIGMIMFGQFGLPPIIPGTSYLIINNMHPRNMVNQVDLVLLVFAGSIIVIISYIYQFLLFPGFIVTALKQIRGEEIHVGDIFKGMRSAWGCFVINLAILAGFIGCFCIWLTITFSTIAIPLLIGCIGIWFTATFFMMAIPMLVDRKTKIRESLIASFKKAERDKLFFMIYILVSGLIVWAVIFLSGFVHLEMIASLLFYPFSVLTMVVAYERTFYGYDGTGIPMMQPGVPIPPPYMPTPEGVIVGPENLSPEEPMAPLE